MRVELYPILSAAATKALSKNLSRVMIPRFEALGHVMPPSHIKEELMNESWIGGKMFLTSTQYLPGYLAPHMCGGCGWDFPHILSQLNRITEPDKPGDMEQG